MAPSAPLDPLLFSSIKALHFAVTDPHAARDFLGLNDPLFDCVTHT